MNWLLGRNSELDLHNELLKGLVEYNGGVVNKALRNAPQLNMGHSFEGCAGTQMLHYPALNWREASGIVITSEQSVTSYESL